MPKITFLPSNVVVDASPGTELLDAAREAGVAVDSPCGGRGTCGKCIVRIGGGQVESGDSLGVLPATMVAEGYVLACRTRVLEQAITVTVPDAGGREGGKLTEEDERYLVRQELLPKEWEFDPLAVKWLLQVEPPHLEDGLSDLDRLRRAVQAQWGKRDVVVPLLVQRRLAAALREDDGRVTATILRAGEALHIIRLEAGDNTTRHYGIAVDVGTTTVAVQLVNLTMGTVLATRSAYNDQVDCGLDVISRINYARRADRLEALRLRVLLTINRLVEQVSTAHRVAPNEICNAVVSGNTTMVHLLLGLVPEYIRLEPYTPTVLEVPYVSAQEVGIKINPDSWICFSPCVGSYVGGDITAGLLCTDLVTESEAVSLFIDIGTNGELVVGNSEFLLTCACSAGPAFEGGGIGCGMRAALGAIERVEIDPASGSPRFATIGHVEPRGICGTGMMDLLANLFLTGWLDPAGRFDRSRSSPHIRMDGKRALYVLADAETSGTGSELTICELDVENILRAKAAIYSACALLLEQVGLGFADLQRIYVAGGFGRFLDLEKAIVLGLLPDVERDRFQFVGNASLMGSYMVVVSQEYRQRQLEVARRMTYVELSTDPAYMDQYTGALFLPHTDPRLFPSVRLQTPTAGAVI